MGNWSSGRGGVFTGGNSAVMYFVWVCVGWLPIHKNIHKTVVSSFVATALAIQAEFLEVFLQPISDSFSPFGLLLFRNIRTKMSAHL